MITNALLSFSFLIAASFALSQTTTQGHHAFGDSITMGAGASAPGNGYAALLAADEGANLTNYGISGGQACDINNNLFWNDNPADAPDTIRTLLVDANDANVKGAGIYEAVASGCNLASYAWLTVPNTYKVTAQSRGCVTTGTWVKDNTGLGLRSASRGTLTCSITATDGVVYGWYAVGDGNSGKFSYSVDGGNAVYVNAFTSPAITTQNGGTSGVFLLRLKGLSSGVHTVAFVVTSATVTLYGIGAAPTPRANKLRLFVGGVLRQYADAKAADTSAYNADVQRDVALLAGDGLPIRFVDVRAYVDPITDMHYGDVHPNDSGHAHLREAFEAVEYEGSIKPKLHR